MTVTSCGQHCLNNRLSYAVVQDNECGCTDTVDYSTMADRVANCSTDCPGAISQDCGSSSHSSIYHSSLYMPSLRRLRSPHSTFTCLLVYSGYFYVSSCLYLYYSGQRVNDVFDLIPAEQYGHSGIIATQCHLSGEDSRVHGTVAVTSGWPSIVSNALCSSADNTVGCDYDAGWIGYKGRCYFFSSELKTFEAAYNTCVANDSLPVSIDRGADEASFLESSIKSRSQTAMTNIRV